MRTRTGFVRLRKYAWHLAEFGYVGCSMFVLSTIQFFGSDQSPSVTSGFHA